MTRAILANLGFEYELADRAPSAAVRAQEARFAAILRLVDGWREAEVVAGDDTLATGELLAWGASERARRAAGPAAEHWPSLESVRTANDKRVSHAIEQRLGIALAGAQIVESVEELEAAARALGHWVAKHPFGVAGREQLRARGWDETVRGRAAGLFSTAAGLVVEPWVDVEIEYSLHMDIADGVVHRVGATQLFTELGTFRGNRTDAVVPDAMWDVATRAAEDVADRGYWGPLGIDAFVGRRQGEPVTRPVVELNARWTFGRLALELARILDADVIWHHPARSRRPPALEPIHAGRGPGRWLLPDWCDPHGASGCWVERLQNGGQN